MTDKTGRSPSRKCDECGFDRAICLGEHGPLGPSNFYKRWAEEHPDVRFTWPEWKAQFGAAEQIDLGEVSRAVMDATLDQWRYVPDSHLYDPEDPADGGMGGGYQSVCECQTCDEVRAENQRLRQRWHGWQDEIEAWAKEWARRYTAGQAGITWEAYPSQVIITSARGFGKNAFMAAVEEKFRASLSDPGDVASLERTMQVAAKAFRERADGDARSLDNWENEGGSIMESKDS